MSFADRIILCIVLPVFLPALGMLALGAGAAVWETLVENPQQPRAVKYLACLVVGYTVAHFTLGLGTG